MSVHAADQPTPTQFGRLIAECHWSATRVAISCGYPPSTGSNWLRGKNSRGNPCEPNARVIAWLERVAAAVRALPPPQR